MRLSKVIEHLYLKVYVGIVIANDKTDIVIELVKSGEVKERIIESFENDTSHVKLQEFIEPYLDESPFHYIAFLNPLAIQGALPTCLKRKAEEFVDISTAITLCQDRRWMVYADKQGLDTLKKEYSSIGIDYIFSPFLVLKYFFHDKVFGDLALFVLTENETISVSVFLRGDLLFAEYLSMKGSEDLLIDAELDDSIELDLGLEAFEEEGFDEGIDLDDLNAIEDLEDLDDLNDIEDLDTLEEIEDFSNDVTDIAESPEKEPEGEKKSQNIQTSTLDGFDLDFKRFQLIQGALQHFYSDAKYENHFIESVYVADGCDVSNDLKNYLEEELFLKVYIRRIDLAAEIVDLAKEEVNRAS